MAGAAAAVVRETPGHSVGLPPTVIPFKRTQGAATAAGLSAVPGADRPNDEGRPQSPRPGTVKAEQSVTGSGQQPVAPPAAVDVGTLKEARRNSEPALTTETDTFRLKSDTAGTAAISDSDDEGEFDMDSDFADSITSSTEDATDSS